MEDIIPFKTMRKLLGEAISDNLKPLLDSPDLILEHITEFLLFVLSITECKHTRAVVAALRKIYFFPQLLSLYFYDNKSPLPADPEDLVETIRNLFSITEYDSLSYLSEYRTKLKEFYHFDQILLLYFNLPPQEQKEPLHLLCKSYHQIYDNYSL
ncbi:6894_t:CDS:1 [Gigaspora margarita]|uniref:6894_t:CDS:1 n=1 Tax=Gigaspora margarita TaxID=4874 RepID=A0ABN7W086_GIGMA|nr:6894_t:CDS:1 [Gigaspora margarita]